MFLVVLIFCTTHVSYFRPEDQDKVRRAISTGQVDASDVPEAAKTSDSSNITEIKHSQKKRKATFEEPALPTRPSTSQLASSQSQPREVIDVDLVEEEVKDEIYCVLTTKVVGIQYYKGMPCPPSSHPRLTLSQVSSALGKKSFL